MDIDILGIDLAKRVFQLHGVVSRNRRNFRHPNSSPARRVSKSIILPPLWKV